MISSRFLIPVSLLIVLALVPTVIHYYAAATTDDGLTVNAINRSIEGFRVESTARRARWVEETFASKDWFENRYTGVNGESVLLFVARSYDLKRLYHHPEIGILRGVDLEREKVVKIASMPDIPIHFLRKRSGAGVAAYVLLYDGEFVENPIIMQLKTSLEMLFSASKPLTLFFVYDSMLQRDSGFEASPAAPVLAEAINSFSLQNASP
jgi:hypothetical protein